MDQCIRHSGSASCRRNRHRVPQGQHSPESERPQDPLLSLSHLKQQPQLPGPLTLASESRLAGSAGTTTSTVRVSTAITPTGIPPSLQGGAQVSWVLGGTPRQIQWQMSPPSPR